MFAENLKTDICKSAVSLKVQPAGSRYFFFNQNSCDTDGSLAMNGKVKNLFDNPPCFRVNQKMAFLVWVFDIAKQGRGSVVRTVSAWPPLPFCWSGGRAFHSEC